MPQRVLGIEDSNKIVSVGGLCRRTLWVDQRSHDVGLIGAIATRPEYRKQGLAETIVQALVDEADQLSLAATFLWGSDHAYYRKFGFEPFGHQCRFRATDLAITPEITREQTRFGDELHFGLSQSILKHLYARRIGLQTTSDDDWFKEHRNTRWISLEDGNRQLQAFIAIDRGIDLPNIIHEWGGDMAGITKLIGAISSGRPELEVICSPRQLHQWPISKENVVIETLALARGHRTSPINWKEDSIWFWGLDSA